MEDDELQELESLVGFHFEEKWRIQGVFFYHNATHEYFKENLMNLGRETLRCEHELSWRLQPPESPASSGPHLSAAQVLAPTYQDPDSSKLFAYLRRTVITRPQWTDHYKLQKTVEFGLTVAGAARAESFDRGDEILTRLGWNYFEWLRRCAGSQISPNTEQRLDSMVRVVSAEIQREQERSSKAVLNREDFIRILDNQMQSIGRGSPRNSSVFQSRSSRSSNTGSPSTSGY